MTTEQLIDHIGNNRGGCSIRDLLDLGCDSATYWEAYIHLSRTLRGAGTGGIVETHRYDEDGKRSTVPTYSRKITADDALLHNIHGAYSLATRRDATWPGCCHSGTCATDRRGKP